MWDGTPRGYGIYEVKGNRLKWVYKKRRLSAGIPISRLSGRSIGRVSFRYYSQCMELGRLVESRMVRKWAANGRHAAVSRI
ncbi:calcineurin-like phosphoesterase C-terminal domain-containing protein [Bacteroides faecis]|uniref:calcineurin-like phosphoesterase C-terminal domain-containing protein n=1 Tax=Bacteroides faecis TaxID=674529 RepID=UPI0035ADD67F